MLSALADHEYLESLDIQDCGVTYNGFAKLGSSKWWTKLRKLKLCTIRSTAYGVKPDKPAFESTLEALQNSKYLQYFSLPAENYAFQPVQNTCRQIALTCTNLKNIDGPFNPSCQDFIQIMKSVNHSLEEITMNLDDQEVQDELYSHLQRCQNLKTFSLCSAYFRRFEIFAHLQNLARLEIRRLWHDGYGRHSEETDLVQAILPNSLAQVRELILWSSSLIFSNAFAAACPNLIRVELEGHVSEATPFIEKCRELEELDLNCDTQNEIDFDPLLTNVWACLSKIKFLSLRATSYGLIRKIECGRMAKMILLKSGSLQGILLEKVLYVRKEMSFTEVLEMLSSTESAQALWDPQGYYKEPKYARVVVSEQVPLRRSFYLCTTP